MRRFVIYILENSILESDKDQDYYATIYSAEIVNTLTNLLFVWLAFRGINNCIQNGHDRIFLVTFIGYLVVGTGSFLFHSTLKCQYLGLPSPEAC